MSVEPEQLVGTGPMPIRSRDATRWPLGIGVWSSANDARCASRRSAFSFSLKARYRDNRSYLDVIAPMSH